MQEPLDYKQILEKVETVARIGKVQHFNGLVLEGNGPDVSIGELCKIYSPENLNAVEAEVVGFREDRVLLLPYGNLDGIYLGGEIIATGERVSVPVGGHLMGRVIDGFGRPLDGKPLNKAEQRYTTRPEPRNPLLRNSIQTRINTGVDFLDCCLPVAHGQRVGIFAGSGVGKSSLLRMLVHNGDADVNVIALIGERGREVVEFVEEVLSDDDLQRTIVVVAAADQPALVRCHAAFAATAIAEYFCDRGKRVALTVDSITRFAMAQREVGMAAGEPLTSRGYTPSVFSALAKLAERAGNFKSGGSITAYYTVLVEGDDFNEPVSDSLRAILDAHIILSRDVANTGMYPAIDLLQSASRLAPKVMTESESKILSEIRVLLNEYEQARDLIDIGAYKSGTNVTLDSAIKFVPKFYELMKQRPEEKGDFNTAMESIRRLLVA